MIGNRALQVNTNDNDFSHYPIRGESDTLCLNNTAKTGIFKHVMSAPKRALRVYISSASVIQLY